MKKLIVLLLAALMLVSAALAEDYSALTTEELKALRNEINQELSARLQAEKAETEQYFTSPDQFIYVDNGEEVMIRGYQGTEADIVIPDQINGLPVTRIADNAFKENGALRSIVIPDSVTEIGPKAFYNCRSLQKVVLSRNVTELKEQTFAFTSALSEINLSHVSIFRRSALEYAGIGGVLTLQAENLRIEASAFCNTKLTAVKIYSDTCEIRSPMPFSKMNALKYFYVSDETQLTFAGIVMTDCPALEALVIPSSVILTTAPGVSTIYAQFEGCTNMVIYTPEGSDLHAYAKENFIRCSPAQYGDMSALLDAMEE